MNQRPYVLSVLSPYLYAPIPAGFLEEHHAQPLRERRAFMASAKDW